MIHAIHISKAQMENLAGFNLAEYVKANQSKVVVFDKIQDVDDLNGKIDGFFACFNPERDLKLGDIVEGTIIRYNDMANTNLDYLILGKNDWEDYYDCLNLITKKVEPISRHSMLNESRWQVVDYTQTIR